MFRVYKTSSTGCVYIFIKIIEQNEVNWTRLYATIYLMNQTTARISRTEKGVINKQIIILAQNPSPTFIIRLQFSLKLLIELVTSVSPLLLDVEVKIY